MSAPCPYVVLVDGRVEHRCYTLRQAKVLAASWVLGGRQCEVRITLAERVA